MFGCPSIVTRSSAQLTSWGVAALLFAISKLFVFSAQAVTLTDITDKLIRVEQPTGTVIARYGYDPYGQRIWKETGGVRKYFYYTQDGLSAELSPTGAVTSTYLFPPDGYWSTDPLAVKSGGTYQYFHNDHLGTPLKLTNSTGAVTWSGAYRPYGAVTETPTGATNNLRFPGQYADPETGLYNNFQRNYDPQTGGYLEVDPYGLMMGPNLYGYAAGNPNLNIDPTGEIAPAIVVLLEFLSTPAGQAALFVVGEAMSGFQVTKCLRSMVDPCAAPGSIKENCYELGIEKLLDYGTGHLLGPATHALRHMKGWADPVIDRMVGPIRNKIDDLVGGAKRWAGAKPQSLTPDGAGRHGAFNEAKRNSGVPTTSQPTSVGPNFDAQGNRQPGRQYTFEVPAPGGGKRRVTIRDDAGGHTYQDAPSQNRGAHFNDPGGNHYDY